jgi:hypothetical protein
MAIMLALAAAVLYSRWHRGLRGGCGVAAGRGAGVPGGQCPGRRGGHAGGPLAAGGPVTTGAPGWGLAADGAPGAGVIVFFAGLAAGPASVVARLSALGAALLPVGGGAAEGEGLGAAVLAGAVLCLAAVTPVSLQGRPAGPPLGRRAVTGVACGIAAGVVFGL